MTRMTVALVAIAALSLGACGDDKNDGGSNSGGSLCDKASKVTAAYGTCQMGDQGGNVPTEKAACEAALAKCNDADKKLLNDFFDCFAKAKPCVAGEEATWAISVMLPCAMPLMGGLSPTCQVGQ